MSKNRKTFKVLSGGALRKKYPNTGLASEILVTGEDTIIIPSEVLAINHQLGGGLPYGKNMELFGEESSGKSLLALNFAKVVQKLGGIVAWVDAEFSFTLPWAIQNGLNPERIMLFQETSIEKISDWALDTIAYYRSTLTRNEPILLVIDSLAALECEENINTPHLDRKAEMGNRAKAIGVFLRDRNPFFSNTGTSCIFINQLRSKIGVSKFEDPDTTPGGQAMKFYADIRLGLYGGKQITAKINGFEEKVGRYVSVRVKKNKVAPPRATLKAMEVYFNADYTKYSIGFNKYSNLVEVLTKMGIITKKSAGRYFLGEELLARGEDALNRSLEKDPDFRKKLLSACSINTLSKTKSMLKGITENRYKLQANSEDSDDE